MKFLGPVGDMYCLSKTYSMLVFFKFVKYTNEKDKFVEQMQEYTNHQSVLIVINHALTQIAKLCYFEQIMLFRANLVSIL